MDTRDPAPDADLEATQSLTTDGETPAEGIEATPPPPRRRLPVPRAVVIAGLAVVVVVVGAGIAFVAARPPAEVAVASPSPTTAATPEPTATPSASPSEAPSPSPSESTANIDRLLGSDGRFTILLLGSDYRPSRPGNRTDTMMVVSVEPESGDVAVASIPRDTTAFPLPGGGTFNGKVNALYQSYVGRLGLGKGSREMKRAVGAALGVEVDWYAIVGFEGVRQLVDAVGGVDVRLSKTVHDPYYWVSPSRQGVTFPAGVNHLTGDRALIFARTRKADNDFARARRQQQLVAAAADAVRERGLKHLPALIGIGQRWVKTDLPLKLAGDVYGIVADAKLAEAKGIVFGPRTWATSRGGTSFSLKLDAVRGWTKEWMAPVKTAGGAATP
jgi:LCP family protein required for cell wall assembly